MNKVQNLISEVFAWFVVLLTFAAIIGALLLALLFITDQIREFI